MAGVTECGIVRMENMHTSGIHYTFTVTPDFSTRLVLRTAVRRFTQLNVLDLRR
jgi:hypothetical protein